MRGVFAAVLILAGLQAVVKSQESATRFGGAIQAAANVTRYIFDPTVPGIPDLAGVDQ